MGVGEKPSLELAKKVLPAPLLKALRFLFAQRLEGCMLVGGTALAGFYAGHRRSDDLDLFTEGGTSQTAAVLAARSLEGLGARVDVRQDSGSYFRAHCALEGNGFTVDVSAAPAAFRAGRFVALEGGLALAELDLLLVLKGAALLSRCSEKDLYDLRWLLARRPKMTIADLLAAAAAFDAGADAENMLISLTGTGLDKESCGFGLKGASKEKIFREISHFKSALVRGLRALAKNGPPSPIADLVKRARRLKGDA
ncbi:MAG: Uncharacterized protein FD126_676 [Elusimicrobia bacterium]|nr:MAG: Uncharacterized protein FD126_676 [Elusimicrobiota bacterium]